MSLKDIAENVFVWFYNVTPALLVLLPGLATAFWARSRLRAALREGSAVVSQPGMTGDRIAWLILQMAHVEDVTIVRASGPLATFFDGNRRELRLSAKVFDGQSIAITALAAHEAGHALQPPGLMVIRTWTIFATGLASTAAWILLVGGLTLAYGFMAMVGSLLYSSLVILSLLIMMPLEINANRRVRQAMENIDAGGWEKSPAFGKALKAASYSHVAALFPLPGRGNESGLE
jgi:Zn-dependent membrane protease YugP